MACTMGLHCDGLIPDTWQKFYEVWWAWLLLKKESNLSSDTKNKEENLLRLEIYAMLSIWVIISIVNFMSSYPGEGRRGMYAAAVPISFSLRTLRGSFLRCCNVPGSDAGRLFHSRDLALKVKHCSTCIVCNYTVCLTLFWRRVVWQSQVCTISRNPAAVKLLHE